MSTNLREEVFSVSEAAKALHRSPATIRRMAEDGRLAARKVGRAWVIMLKVCPACGKAE